MQVEAKTNTVWHVPQIVKAIFMADDAAGLCGWVQALVNPISLPPGLRNCHQSVPTLSTDINIQLSSSSSSSL